MVSSDMDFLDSLSGGEEEILCPDPEFNSCFDMGALIFVTEFA